MSIEKLQVSNLKLQAANDQIKKSYKEAMAAQGNLKASNSRLNLALERVSKELADFKSTHVLVKNGQTRKNYYAYEKRQKKRIRAQFKTIISNLNKQLAEYGNFSS